MSRAVTVGATASRVPSESENAGAASPSVTPDAAEVRADLEATFGGLPLHPAATASEPAHFDGASVMASYFLTEPADDVIDWYVEELGRVGWSTEREREVFENHLDAGSPAPVAEPRTIRTVIQGFERGGAVVRISASDDPYKDVSYSGSLFVTVLGEAALAAGARAY
ncbi:MAG TPA: hypothetical protein VMR52_03865 [Dehalococcoidia bacterium]|nr:hypothetical protein [Dehalococcoidia bacterium]